ncbi:hypothetical protein [Phaeacidiphilus oryzae]|uniref:hypothetical protein n=1 Tax=Phaeacidiphilus oryzae TaxID=348818 RepID=UPI000691D00B|nr:hypothetical protein [Phaeacidiphilus oryzae]
MNLGFAVLYAAFAVVAAWLLAEVLLQHRAPLHWRLLALAGFLGVAGGVYLRNVPVIVAGVAAFGAGQLMVGRMHKLPGAEGRYWALRRPYPAEDFEDGPHPAEDRPVGEVGPVEPVEPVESSEPLEPAALAEPLPPLVPGYPHEQPPPLYEQQPDYAQPVYDLGGYQQPDGATPVYSMEPLPEDSDNYGVYTGLAAQQVREQYAAEGYQQPYQQQPYEQPQYDQAAYDQQQYAQYQQQYAHDYPYTPEQQQYAQYQQQYAEQGYYVDEYGQYQPYQPQPQSHQQPAAEGYYAPES